MKNAFNESLSSYFYHKTARYVASLVFFSALTACSGSNNDISSIIPASLKSEETARIGLIVPLTGPNAAIGRRMKEAALLALKIPENNMVSSNNTHPQVPEMDVFDSHAVGGAKKAAQAALAAGDKIVIGPIRSVETGEVADILQASSIPELAFTSDIEQARPNAVWIMGLTPEQQVHRLVDMAVAEGRKQFAAFLPDSPLGHALAQGLVKICQEKGLDVPKIIFHTRNISSITDGMARLSNLKEREASIAADVATSPTTDEKILDNSNNTNMKDKNPTIAVTTGASLEAKPLPAPPFDALLLADTGLDLAHVIEALKANQIDSLKVRLMGPALWKAFDSKLGDLKGAWYSAPDDNLRMTYIHNYQNAYHQKPSPVTDFAYDASRLARKLIEERQLTPKNLTSSEGYEGVGGHYNLLEDGHVVRSLAIYQILLGGGAHAIIPAKQ